MNNSNCPKFEDCSVPICPLQQNTIESGIWYPGEDICKRRDFQTLDWIRKQKAIIKAKAPNDKYFTVEMLKAITRVKKGVVGIDPDQPLDKARRAEQNWVLAFKKRAKLQSYDQGMESNSIAKKKGELVFAGKTSHQETGGQNDNDI